jgi:integrase
VPRRHKPSVEYKKKITPFISKGALMSIYKRGKVYWYKFMWNGEVIRESTKQGNQNTARNMESAHRTALANGLVGIRSKKPIPTLREFCTSRFEPWAKSTFEKNALNNWLWFRGGIRALLGYRPMANAKLNIITNELAAEFASHRQASGKQVSTVNSSLRVLRRILGLAAEWGVLETRPTISLIPGERHRETVVTPREQRLYFDHAPEPLKSIATILVETGIRPDECYRLRWEDLHWGSFGKAKLRVTKGKTPAARRVIPMSEQVHFILETRWELAGKPSEGWIWPAATKVGHVDHSTLKKKHALTFRTANAAIAEQNQREHTHDKELVPWVLYSFRHTFLTRLGQSGCDAWTLARIAGHASIAISSRYVHPSQDAVSNAMFRLSGHNIRHSDVEAKNSEAENALEVVEGEGEVWCARRDSNSRPIAPEAIALSS